MRIGISHKLGSAAIAKALADAKARGVDIEVILDKSQWAEKYSGATYLANHKIPVLIDDKHAIAHNKVMIIDNNIVITGSFNFTKAAEEKNAENVIVLKDNPRWLIGTPKTGELTPGTLWPTPARAAINRTRTDRSHNRQPPLSSALAKRAVVRCLPARRRGSI